VIIRAKLVDRLGRSCLGLAFRIGSGLLLLAVALDQVFDGAFDDVAVTSFRVATAGEVNLVTVCDSVFYLLGSEHVARRKTSTLAAG
jgi:hypothetical protein